MNDKLIMRLYQDAYHEVMMPHLIVKNGSPILDYKTTDGVDSKIREKFVELLVKECEQISLKNSHRDDDMGAIIARQINQHFGIEQCQTKTQK